MKTDDQEKVSIGAYITLAFAVVFFSGLLKSNEWYGVFDFTTLNGSFGRLMKDATGGMAAFRGVGGSGAADGFLFALGLVPTAMFALGMIAVLEHYGALKAARKMLTPLLRPLMGIPGSTGLAIIGSLQSTDVGAGLTKSLADEGELTATEKDVFTAFQFSGGALIVNFFGSGAILFTLSDTTGAAVPGSIGLALAVMFIFKIVGANIMRFYLKTIDKKSGEKAITANTAEAN
ncbi:nucleoside recognition domain-containing protein [Salinisphaera sp. G21_0]|uniref:nucleoside recognition domain-containing protein n=1 Tax=Salinisphaera sp. G21_0 TaxID=2821094 RepID=UPI001ADD16E1|nr:nucleoside recognition domain-containing protein [Salinisphaera sp. G21_0]MBO9482973.1 YjiH family protein [Salinisphaera sp. G21_0]